MSAAHRIPLILAACAILALRVCAEEQQPAALPELFLIPDYCPAAIYEGDPLTVCLRIENASRDVGSFDVSGTACDHVGKELKRNLIHKRVLAGKFETANFDFDTATMQRVSFELKRDGVDVGSVKFGAVLLRENEPWPQTKFENGRLVLAANGEVLIPVVVKKRTVEDRAFLPIKWILGGQKSARVSTDGPGAVFVPGAWKLNFANASKLGPWQPDGSPPLLKTMACVLDSLQIINSRKPADAIKKVSDESQEMRTGRVVIVLPPDDLDLGTDPRIYRVVLEAFLTRLIKAGFTQVTLVEPCKYGSIDRHRDALWREIRAAAELHGATVFEPAAWKGESYWRLDESAPGVYAGVPNASGRKMIEQALADLIR